MSILDTVEPDAWAREWEGDDSDIGQYCVVFHEDEKDINPNWFEVYSRDTVEAILLQYRKEVRKELYTELIAHFDKHDFLDNDYEYSGNAVYAEDELSRMKNEEL